MDKQIYTVDIKLKNEFSPLEYQGIINFFIRI